MRQHVILIEATGGERRERNSVPTSACRPLLAYCRVRGKFAQTKQQLDQAENATESTWGDVKSGFRESYAGLKESIGITRRWLSDRIAP
jgi:hypothetical protein